MDGRWSFERGDKVRILEGPYRGFEGVIDEATAAEGRLHALRHEGVWLTVNTPKDLRVASEYLAENPGWPAASRG